MTRFLEKKNEYINYVAYNLNTSFFIFISSTWLTNSQHLQQGKHFTFNASKRLRSLLIMKHIINIFASLKSKPNSIVFLRWDVDREHLDNRC